MAKRTPQNRVGHKLLTAQQAEQMKSGAVSVKTSAQELGPTLSVKERKSLRTPRIGYENMAAIILHLAESEKLHSRYVSVEGIRADLELAAQITPIFHELALAFYNTWDVLRQARSESWEGVLHFYSVLTKMAAGDPQLKIALSGASEFMSTKTRKEQPAEKKTAA